jgi:hypothetical protein
MKAMKRLSYISLLFVLGAACFSCNKVLDKYPPDKPADVNFLETGDELNLAVNGLYNNLWMTYSASGQWEYILDNTTDIGFDRNQSIFTFIGNGTVLPSSTDLDNIWKQYYAGIGRCNYLLENIGRVNGTSQQTLDQADGQARFLRAYWYYQLTTLWGDVPLVLKPQGLEDNQVAKTPVSQIIDTLLLDLDRAAQELPDTWGTADKGKVTKGAALALKSRIALVGGRYDLAAAAAQQVIESPQYSLYPDYAKLFTYAGESNSEVIFEVDYAYGVQTHRMPISLFSRNAQGNSTKVPTQSMVDSYECTDGLTIDQSPLYDPHHPFENRDPRMRQTIAVPGDVFLGFQFETYKDSLQCWNYSTNPAKRVGNQDATNAYASFSGYCWRKSTDSADLGAYRNASSLNCIVIRLAEVLLNYAEAKIELNQIDASCLEAINRIRQRPTVNMPPIAPGKTQAEMRTIVRRERKIELAMEGLRFQDIRRWKLAEKVMPGPLYGRPQKPYNYADQGVPSIDADGVVHYDGYADKLSVIEQRSFDPQKSYLLPIPQRELDVNKELVQNPGY